MEIFRVIGVGIITCLMVVIVKQVKPELAVFVGIAGGIIMILMIASSILNILDVFSSVAQKSGLSNSLFVSLLKIVGVGYLTEFAANICYDSGSSGLADKMLLAGKIIILTIAMPVVTTILDIVIELLP